MYFMLLNAWLIDCLFVHAALGTSSASMDMGMGCDGMGIGDMELIGVWDKSYMDCVNLVWVNR